MFAKSRIPAGSMLTEGALPSRLQGALYRRRGYRIAPDVEFAPGVVIDADEVIIGPGCSIGFGTVLRGRRIHLGRRVDIGSLCFFEGRDIEIGDDTVVREQVFVGGPLEPDSLLRIGKRVRIFQMCFLNPTKALTIGDDTGVGGRSSLFTHGSWQSQLEGYPVTFAPIEIGKNVWLPWHVFILPGVQLGDNVTIGAGSVVNKSVGAGALAAGVPAKVLREAAAWPRRLGPEQQWIEAQGMVRAWVKYLHSNGVRAELDEGPGRLSAAVPHEGNIRRVTLTESAEAGARLDAEIRVFLRASDTSAISLQGVWFDLLGKRKGGALDAVAVELEEYINRYGIRFAPADEV